MKIAGIHWMMGHPDTPRLAEITAGFIQTSVNYQSSSTGHGYNNIMNAFINPARQVNLHFTCLEMGNQNWNPAYSRAEDLVFWVAEAADNKEVSIKGENALPGELGGSFAWDQIDNALEYASYIGITILRISDVTNGGTGQSRYEQLINMAVVMIGHHLI